MSSGGSVLFNYLVTASLQVWTRISFLIAFLAVVGLALLLERACSFTRAKSHGRWLASAVLAVVLVAGVFEGTSNRFIPAYGEIGTTWHDDAAFVAEVQHSLPANSMVLELPYVPYPEAALPTGFTSYEPQVPYLHSTTLRWSGGAMAGRSTDWLASWSGHPTDELIEGATAAGFKGVYIFRSGYADQGAAVTGAIQSLTGVLPMTDADGSAMFVNLQSFEARLRMKLPGSSIAALGRATIFPLAVSYAQGFYGIEPGVGEPRWGERTDTITINNPAKASQMANYSVTLTTGYPSSSEVRVKWPGNAQSRLKVTNRGVTVKRVLTLPPGNSTIEFITDAARVSAPADPRMLYLHFANPTLTPTAFTAFSKVVAESVPANQNETP
jgi:phosphoglycerol transferase